MKVWQGTPPLLTIARKTRGDNPRNSAASFSRINCLGLTMPIAYLSFFLMFKTFFLVFKILFNGIKKPLTPLKLPSFQKKNVKFCKNLAKFCKILVGCLEKKHFKKFPKAVLFRPKNGPIPATFSTRLEFSPALPPALLSRPAPLL